MMMRKWMIAMTAVAAVACSDTVKPQPDDQWDLTEEDQTPDDTVPDDTDDDTVPDDDDDVVDDTDDDTTIDDDTDDDTIIDDDTDDNCLPSEPVVHRETATECDQERGPGTTPPDDPFAPADCATDDDCTDGKNGRCVGNGHDGWYCTYDLCFDDGGCGTDSVCECEGGFRSDHNVCLPGNCQTDADCGETGFCSPSFGTCGDYSGVVGYFCHTCEDECVNDSDCGGDGQYGEPYCMYESSVGHWVCSNSHCAG